MPTKIRLQRKGKKGYAYYHIVIADSRSPRDGRYIERIGIYNPNTNPATIELDFTKALTWVQRGAQPTDTCRAILSYKGVLLKKHLLEGVKKGAFDEKTAEERFNNWLQEKEQKISSKKLSVEKQREQVHKKWLDGEQKTRAAKAEILAVKTAKAAEKAQEATQTEENTPSETNDNVAEPKTE